MSPNLIKHTSNNIISIRDAESFHQLYSTRHLIVYRYIYGLLGGPTEDVEDLTSEVFARAWKSRWRFRGTDSSATGWLLKIARNLVIDAHRRQKSQGFSQDIEKHIVITDELDPEEQLQIREQVKTLWSLLHKLSDQHREILVLRYMLGWRVQEISHHLEMKENTVSVYIRRAIRRIRQDWPMENEEYK